VAGAAWSDLTQEQQDKLLHRMATDFWFYAEHSPLKIKDKRTRELVPLRPNFAQMYVWRRKAQMARSGRPVRLLIPKSRQLGMTTGFTAEKLWLASTRKEQEIFLLMHDTDLGNKVWRNLERMMENQDPMWRQPPAHGSRIGARIQLANGSTISVDSARKRGAGRGETLDHVHACELPDWEDPVATLDGLEEAVPDIPYGKTSIVLESTCQGIGDHWYWLCQRAVKGKGQYELVFLPWWLEPAYERTPMPGELRREPLTADEEAIGKRIIAEAPMYGVPVPSTEAVIRKILWRRSKIENRGYDKFCQEYPMDLDEGFLGTGRPVFSTTSIRWHRSRVHEGERVIQPPIARMVVEETGRRHDSERGKEVRSYRWRKERDAPFALWEKPIPDAAYVLGCDSASGEARDRSAIQVVKIADPRWSPDLVGRRVEQVGVWHGDIGGKQLAYVLAFLARQFNNGLMVPENNNTGQIVLETLNGDIRYPGMRLYQHEHLDMETGHRAVRYGFNTNVQTRPALIEAMFEIMRTEDIWIRCEHTMAEIAQFAYNKKGRPEAPAGGYDDLVFALMLAVYARHHARRRKAQIKRIQSFDYGEFSQPLQGPRVRASGHTAG
jgi:hypothetical protein